MNPTDPFDSNLSPSTIESQLASIIHFTLLRLAHQRRQLGNSVAPIPKGKQFFKAESENESPISGCKYFRMNDQICSVRVYPPTPIHGGNLVQIPRVEKVSKGKGKSRYP